MTSPEQRRLRRSVALHGFAVVVFALLALSGAGAATQGLYGLAVPFIITGTTGAVGAAMIAVSVWREAAGTGDTMDSATATTRHRAPQRTIRLTMAAVAVVVLVAGVTLAPEGLDRGFVVSVAALLAAMLALFALLAGDRPRTTGQPN